MKAMKRISAMLISILVLLSLCACGSKSAIQAAKTDSSYNDYVAANGEYMGFAPAAAMSEEMAMADEAYYSEPSESEAPAPSPNEKPQDNQDKIIYSSDVTVETTEFDEAVSSLQDLIKKYNGWVESSSINGSNLSNIQQGKKTNRSADYTIRVPSEFFNTIMAGFSTLGNVPYNHVYTSNVTSQYYDTAARLKTYKAQEERLLELLDMANTVKDVIEVENELTEVRYRIESLQTSLNNWDRQVSYSTIYLNLREVNEYTPQDSPSYGGRLLKSLKNGFNALGEFIIDLVGALPIIAVVALIVFALVKLIKRLRKNSPARKEKRRAKKEIQKIEETP